MDVRCAGCATEYEFDDALISERGTTVKCTTCGNQFKVFPRSGGGAPERWVVRTSSGRELVYTSLRELQRGIAQGQISPLDMFSRGSQPTRPLGSISELEPFFKSQTPSEPKKPDTLHGVAPPANRVASGSPGAGSLLGVASTVLATPGSRPPRPAPAAAAAIVKGEEAPVSSDALPTQQSYIAGGALKRGPGGTMLGTRPEAVFASPQPPAITASAPAVAQKPVEQPAQPDVTRTQSSDQPAAAYAVQAPRANQPPPQALPDFTRTKPSEPPPVEYAAAPPPQPAAHVQAALQAVRLASVEPSSPALDATLPTARSGVHHLVAQQKQVPPQLDPQLVTARSEQPFAAPAPSVSRRARMRWIGGLILVLVVSLLGVTVGRKYLSRFTPAAAPEVERKSDERVTKLVQQGNQLLERGDLEAAKEQFDKATALSENDPGLLLALARLEVIRADQLWLRLRLLDPKDEGLVRLTHRQLGARVGKAQAALERARKVARQTTTGAESRPAAADEVSLVRSEVDARRMNGELELARSLVGPLLKNPTQPENAYVLAALDLADASPVWSSALERLRIAASAEQQLGRAQAALVYALTRAGKLNDAQSELEKMEARTDTHPLLPDLRGFVHRYSIVADAGAEAHKSAVAVDVAALPKLDTSPAPEDESDDAVKTPAPIKPGDFRLKLEEASVALHNGQLGRALQLYQEVQSAQPGNTEALAGLADVESRRGNSAKAAELYQSVLAQNPSYLPAMVGVADQKWASGDKKGALVLYRRILEQSGAGSTYGQRAAARLQQGESGKGSPASQTAEPATAAPVEAPQIDTTDLPGH